MTNYKLEYISNLETQKTHGMLNIYLFGGCFLIILILSVIGYLELWTSLMVLFFLLALLWHEGYLKYDKAKRILKSEGYYSKTGKRVQ